MRDCEREANASLVMTQFRIYSYETASKADYFNIKQFFFIGLGLFDRAYA